MVDFEENQNRKSKGNIMNPLTHLSFLSIGMWNNFTLTSTEALRNNGASQRRTWVTVSILAGL